jgi:dTDP-4-dehydrorhamnose reductase
MKVVVVGRGQLARELLRTAPASMIMVSLGRPELDITRLEACTDVLQRHTPDIVINAAAYTAVDKAESDSALAFAVNEQGAANLAIACQAVGARLFHVSTDFVFEGACQKPYAPDAVTNPQGAYGASKLAGEQAVLRLMPAAVIVRTSWLYSSYGQNFVKTMLRLMAEKPALNVVSDQVGSPTWAKGLALVLWAGISKKVPGGIYHWSDRGEISWYDFAVEIQAIAVEVGLLPNRIPVHPIPSRSYPTPARRPAYSVLDSSRTQSVFGVACADWRLQLRAMLAELVQS